MAQKINNDKKFLLRIHDGNKKVKGVTKYEKLEKLAGRRSVNDLINEAINNVLKS